MTWGKVHGSITWHAKTLAAGDAALGVWTRLLGHCAEHLTDGFVPGPVAVAVSSSSPGSLDALVHAGLLETAEGGYRLHDYLDHNSSRADVEAARANARDRKARSRSAAKAMQSRVTGRVTDAVSHAVRPFAGEIEEDREEKEETDTSRSRVTDAVTGSEPEKTGAVAPASASAGGVVRSVFEYWQQVHEHPNAKLDPKRRRAIERALKSHGEETVRAAIDGCSKSPFHKGANERGQVYDDVTLILRDASKIEAFAALSTPMKPARSTVVERDPLADPLNVSPFKRVLRKAVGE